jgi:hypothetical protein
MELLNRVQVSYVAIRKTEEVSLRKLNDAIGSNVFSFLQLKKSPAKKVNKIVFFTRHSLVMKFDKV